LRRGSDKGANDLKAKKYLQRASRNRGDEIPGLRFKKILPLSGGGERKDNYTVSVGEVCELSVNTGSLRSETTAGKKGERATTPKKEGRSYEKGLDNRTVLRSLPRHKPNKRLYRFRSSGTSQERDSGIVTTKVDGIDGRGRAGVPTPGSINQDGRGGRKRPQKINHKRPGEPTRKVPRCNFQKKGLKGRQDTSQKIILIQEAKSGNQQEKR